MEASEIENFELKDAEPMNCKIKNFMPEVKEGEAVLEQILREVEIECLPLDIPEKIEIDISGLSVGESVHVGDVKLADSVKVITHLEETIATVSHKTEEEEEPVEAALEGEAPQEPEVIKEKKEEADSGEKEEPGKKAKKTEKAE